MAQWSDGRDPRTGQRVRRTRYFYTEEDAEDFLIALQYRRSRGEDHSAARRLTFDAFFESWLQFQADGEVDPSTSDRYRYIYRHVAPLIGQKTMADLDGNRAEIRNALERLGQNGLSQDAVEKSLRFLRSMFRRALDDGLIFHSPTQGVRLPKSVKTRNISRPFLRPDDVDRLLTAVRGHRLEALFYVAVQLGLRPGEAYGLQWKDIDFDANTLMVRRQVTKEHGTPLVKPPKTESSFRTLTLPVSLRRRLRDREIQAFEEGQRAVKWVFTSPMGRMINPDNFRRRVWNPARQAAGLPTGVPFKALRTTACTLLFRQGVSPVKVQKIMGHASLQVTQQIYHQVSPELLQEGADAMDNLIDELGLTPAD